MIGMRGIPEVLKNLQTKTSLITDDEIRMLWKTEFVHKVQ
jgi:hypothetical protein